MLLFAGGGYLDGLLVVLGICVILMIAGGLFKLTRMAQDDIDQSAGEQIDLPSDLTDRPSHPK